MALQRALTIAGSDSGGGAGIQADLKTFTALGVYGMSAVTAVTAQNTLGVQGIYPLPAAAVAQQIDSVATDIGVDAAKTGMLADPEVISAVADRVRTHGIERLVVDPVMVARSGDRLVSPAAREALVRELLPLAAVVTPNLDEAEALAGIPIRDREAMRVAAERILALGPRAVVIKGGRAARRGDAALDLYRDRDREEWLERPPVPTRHTHGAGCTFSAALCAGLAQGIDPLSAVELAKSFTHAAILAAPGLGSGHGPLNHLLQGDWR